MQYIMYTVKYAICKVYNMRRLIDFVGNVQEPEMHPVQAKLLPSLISSAWKGSRFLNKNDVQWRTCN